MFPVAERRMIAAHGASRGERSRNGTRHRKGDRSSLLIEPFILLSAATIS
jgi:hypothetical protein